VALSDFATHATENSSRKRLALAVPISSARPKIGHSGSAVRLSNALVCAETAISPSYGMHSAETAQSSTCACTVDHHQKRSPRCIPPSRCGAPKSPSRHGRRVVCTVNRAWEHRWRPLSTRLGGRIRKAAGAENLHIVPTVPISADRTTRRYHFTPYGCIYEGCW
jgi:hypothetical protein